MTTLTIEEFEKNISDNLTSIIHKNDNGDKKIAVAVSGGSDSLSLVIALHKAKFNVIAILVNHNLRKSSKEEIVKTKKTLSKFNIKTVVKNWDGNVKKNLESEARNARYNLLFEACVENNINTLCIGHHIDDQVETFLLNLTRGSGLDGLCAMPISLSFNYHYNSNNTINRRDNDYENHDYKNYIKSDDTNDIDNNIDNNGSKDNRKKNNTNCNKIYKINVIRPMLSITKQNCRKYLSSLRIKWCEDESNSDVKYKRNKIRFLMEQIEDKELLTKRISNTITSLQEVRETIDFLIEETIKRIVVFDKKKQLYSIKHNDFINLTKYLQKSVLTRCIMTLSNREYKLRLYQIYNLIDSINSEEKVKKTIAHCIVEVKQDKKKVSKVSINKCIAQNNTATKNTNKVQDNHIALKTKEKTASGIHPSQEKEIIIYRQ